MLGALILENFKAFGDRQVIRLAPITLIFGANSSGKSSILQSLLLLKQTLANVGEPTAALSPRGGLVDLGGFDQFVHRHDGTKTCEISPLLPWDDFYDVDIPFRSPVGPGFRFATDSTTREIYVASIPFYSGDTSRPAYWLAPIGESRSSMPHQSAHRIGKSAAPVPSEPPSVALDRVDPQHDIWREWFGIRDVDEDGVSMWQALSLASGVLRDRISESRENTPEEQEALKALRGLIPRLSTIERRRLAKGLGQLATRYANYTQESLIEDVQRYSATQPLTLDHFLPSRERLATHPYSPTEAAAHWLVQTLAEENDLYLSHYVTPTITGLTTTVAIELGRTLRDLQYVGPSRDRPSRHYIFGGSTPTSVGPSGASVPDLLYRDPSLIERMNDVLGRIDLGYRLNLHRMADPFISDTFTVRLTNEHQGVDVNFTDVGFGIGQLLPIVVQSLISQGQVVLVEQPELHLHPRLQAELGDVFIQSALGGQGNMFLLETHSEHLILRIMRRMRETAKGRLKEGMPPVRPEDVAVIYVEPSGDRRASVARVKRLDEEGDLIDEWPDGFFEEGYRETFAAT